MTILSGLHHTGIGSKLRAGCAALLLVIACAMPGNVESTLAPRSAFQGPRELTILGPRSDVTRAIEDSLRAAGFTVKRFASAVQIAEATEPRRVESYNQAASRYVLEVDADVMDKCFGGGFRFNSLRVDVIDTKLNEVVMSLSSSGYSERCPPRSGNVFGGIVRSIDASWEREQSR